MRKTRCDEHSVHAEPDGAFRISAHDRGGGDPYKKPLTVDVEMAIERASAVFSGSRTHGCEAARRGVTGVMDGIPAVFLTQRTRAELSSHRCRSTCTCTTSHVHARCSCDMCMWHVHVHVVVCACGNGLGNGICQGGYVRRSLHRLSTLWFLTPSACVVTAGAWIMVTLKNSPTRSAVCY